MTIKDENRTIPTGLESAFIASWGGWDEMEIGALQFYDAELKDVMGLPTDVLYDVYVDTTQMIVEVYSKADGDGQPEVVATRKMTVSIS